MKNRFSFVLATAAVVALSASLASAQASSNKWQYAIAPYLWGAGMDGTLTIGDQQANIDVPFSDILDDLDFALMGHFDMRNDRWLVVSDLVFVDLEDKQDLTRGTLKAGVDLTIFEAAGGYRVSPAIALIAGARWVDMSASLSYSGELAQPDADAGESWIDPVVGINVFTPLSKNEKWWLGAYGDIGGFGIGSQLTWELYANVGYRASHLVSIVLGYRALDIDYEGGSGARSADLDLLISGPELGVVFVF